jgi:hypothetical protein
MINVLNHYWVIANSATDVYSSATNTLVPNTDQAFVDWSVVYGGASPIPSEAELAGVLQPYNSLPAWLFAATDTFIQPTPSTYTKGQLAAYAGSARYNAEISGTLSSGQPLRTDRVSRTAADQALAYVNANPGTTVNWKTLTGFEVWDQTMITTYVTDINRHVQDCFNGEKTANDGINDGSITTLAQIDAIFAPLKG